MKTRITVTVPQPSGSCVQQVLGRTEAEASHQRHREMPKAEDDKAVIRAVQRHQWGGRA